MVNDVATFDEVREDFATGARNAVRTCLNIGAQDRVFIIRDRPRREIADAIEEEAASTGADVRAWTMEDHVERLQLLAAGVFRFDKRESVLRRIETKKRGESLNVSLDRNDFCSRFRNCVKGRIINVRAELDEGLFFRHYLAYNKPA